MPVSDEVKLDRMRSANRGLMDLRWKMWQLRRLFLGDQDALDVGRGVGVNQDSYHGMQRPDRNYQPDIMVQDLREGRSSDLLNLLSGLVFKTYYNVPTVRLAGVKPKDRAVNAQWLSYMLGPVDEGGCSAVEQGQIALLDFVISGLGALYVGLSGDKPFLRWVDAIDLSWDLTARLVGDARWMSVSSVNPLHVWMELYPEAKVLQEYAGTTTRNKDGQWEKRTLDRPTTLEFYWDVDEVDGKAGHGVFLKTSDNTYEKDPVWSGDTPYTFSDMGKDRPYIPVETISFLAAPGSRWPVGIAEKMMPAQSAIWGLTEAVQQNLAACKSFYEVVVSQIEAKDVDEFLEGVEGGIVKVKGPGAIVPHTAMPLQQAVLEELARQQQALTMQSGVSPNITGNKNQGKTTATEIRQIAAQGELTAAYVSSSNARLFERTAKKMLRVGKKYFTSPFVCTIGENEVQFGKGTQLGPVADYLKPEAKLTVSEDDMRYRSEAERVQKAMLEVNVAKEFVQIYPNWLDTAVRSLGDALGHDNLDEIFEKPQAAPPVAGPGMPVPGQPAVVPGGQTQTAVG